VTVYQVQATLVTRETDWTTITDSALVEAFTQRVTEQLFVRTDGAANQVIVKENGIGSFLLMVNFPEDFSTASTFAEVLSENPSLIFAGSGLLMDYGEFSVGEVEMEELAMVFSPPPPVPPPPPPLPPGFVSVVTVDGWINFPQLEFSQLLDPAFRSSFKSQLEEQVFLAAGERASEVFVAEWQAGSVYVHMRVHFPELQASTSAGNEKESAEWFAHAFAQTFADDFGSVVAGTSLASDYGSPTSRDVEVASFARRYYAPPPPPPPYSRPSAEVQVADPCANDESSSNDGTVINAGSVGNTGSAVASFGSLTTTELSFDSSCDSASTIPSALGLLTLLEAMSWMEVPFLKGSIPTELGRLSQLESLIIQRQPSLSGTIPTELGLLSLLTLLTVDGAAQLTGTIPTEVGLLTSLHSLSFQSLDALTGTIPTELGLLSELSMLSLAHSPSISGTVPTELGQLSWLVHITFDTSKSLQGDLPQELLDLRWLEVCVDAWGVNHCANDDDRAEATITDSTSVVSDSRIVGNGK